jgi:hypothetical protein
MRPALPRLSSWITVASLMLLAAPSGVRGGEAEGELQVIFRIQQKTSVPFGSVRELNRYLGQGLALRVESRRPQPLDVVLASVVVAADGEILGQCLSERIRLRPGPAQPLRGICGPGVFTRIEGRREGPLRLGPPFAFEPDERLGTDMRPLSVLGGEAASYAERRGSPLLAIGVFPVDPEVAQTVRTGWLAYPCGLPF